MRIDCDVMEKSAGDTIKNGDKSFSKLFDIIELIGASRAGLRGRDIVERTGISTSTTFRMLKFMVDKGYLQNNGNCYTLGPGFVRLGTLAREQNPLQKMAHPFLEELAERTLETVHLAALRGKSICYFDKVEGRRSVRMSSLIGSSSPLYCTGVGKAILAFLPEKKRNELLAELDLKAFTPNTLHTLSALRRELEQIRERGVAIDDCEHELGVYCLAAPIFDYAGNVIAGVSISGSELYLRERSEELVALVRQTAKLISEACSN